MDTLVLFGRAIGMVEEIFRNKRSVNACIRLSHHDLRLQSLLKAALSKLVRIVVQLGERFHQESDSLL